MEEKKSFILYADLIHTVSKMPSDKAGDLFKHILQYVNDDDPITEDLIVELTFEPIKQQLKRDLSKWEDKKGKQSEKGREGNLKRWNLSLYNEYKKGKHTLEDAENIAKSRKVSLPDKPDSSPIAKIAVNDTVNVSVNVNDNVKKKETIDFIYSLYPTKCPIKECSTGKSIKCKDKIKELLKTKSKEELENTITKYLLDCKKSKTWLRNFKTLLNDLPDYSEEIENNKSIYTEIMKKENITLEMLKFESIEKLEKWEKTKKWRYDQNGVKEDWKTYFTKLLKNRI